MAAPSLHRGSRHEIPVRRPGFDFEGDIPNHWLAANALATHFFNGLNLVFPDGERFFIDAVRSRMDRIDEAELKRQIRGFFGQEGRHAHEHERYFETLEAQGYEIQGFLRRFRTFTRFATRWLPAPLRLSMTAGAEHYTATLGALALSDGFIDGAHPVMRDLIVWHATEEIEHKAVAFDVLQATHPSLALRWLGFGLATASLFGWTIVGTHMLVRQDLKAGRLSRTQLGPMRRELRERRARLAGRVGSSIRDYLRRDFHPNDVDDLSLAKRRLAELGLEPAAV
jgi:predicted metal-dependent hydrolase